MSDIFFFKILAFVSFGIQKVKHRISLLLKKKEIEKNINFAVIKQCIVYMKKS